MAVLIAGSVMDHAQIFARNGANGRRAVRYSRQSTEAAVNKLVAKAKHGRHITEPVSGRLELFARFEITL